MSGQRFRRTPGGVCSLGLHLVWCPKYRRRVLGGRVARRPDELVEQIAAEHGWGIVAHEVMLDHVQLFVRVDRPKRQRGWCGRSRGALHESCGPSSRTCGISRRCCGHRSIRRLGRLRVGDDGAPLYRASGGRGAGIVSQQVKITRTRVHGSPVYLGEVTAADGTGSVWSADPERVLGWLCDGFRFRFNQRRSTRCRYLACEDRNGDRVLVIDPAGEPVLGADRTQGHRHHRRPSPREA